MFHPVDWEAWPRRDHFKYYYNQIKCRYTLTAHIDIAPLRVFQKQRQLKFFPLMLYAVMRAVNENKEFRMSFDADGRLGYWDEVVPCYTVFHDEDKTFSDIWSAYNADLHTFYKGVVADLKAYGETGRFVKAKPDQVSVKKFSVFPLDLDNKRVSDFHILQNMCPLQPFCQLPQRAAC